MVAHDEELVRLHLERSHRLPVAVLAEYVAFVQPLIVDDDGSIIDFYRVARYADHALDIRFGGVHGKPENHHVASRDVTHAKPVDELVDEDPLLVDERRH